MSVHYKFKSALDFDTIAFDGLHISVDDLKKAILHQKRLGKTVDFDLQITNAQTKEEYTDDATLIPKNTSLIIARIPLARQPKKAWDPSADKGQNRSTQNESESTNADLLRMNGSEEDKINAMMIQSTMDYDPNNYQKIRGANQTGEVPANYRCYKCHNPGHWIKNCPLNLIAGEAGSDVKRNTGIPRSFIDGQNETIVQPITGAAITEKKQEIPEDLLCSICKDLYADAVMIPCCGSSFCDECVRTALLESEDNECPDCKVNTSSPGSLIPNRFLRNSVNLFKNETGYIKARPPPKPQVQPIQQPVEVVVEPPVPSPKEVVEEPSASTPEEPVTNTTEKEKPAEKVVDEQRAETPHEESDYEDNITVTVPPAHAQSGDAFRDFHLNGRGRHMTSMETSKHHHIHVHHHSHEHEEGSDTPTNDEKEVYQDLPDVKQQHQHERPPPNYHHQSHHMHQQHQQPPQMSNMQMPQPDQYQQMGPAGYSHPNPPPQRPYDGSYGHQQSYPPRQYEQHMQHRPPMQHRGGYHGGPPMQHQMRHRFGPMAPNLITSVYQTVTAKIGSGIIDDPLEAFNRIMQEKERRKEERRASPSVRRRSRSNELRRRSPITDRRRSPLRGARSPDNRRRTPERRGGRSPRSEERRRKRSHSYDTRLSRSFSRSRSRSIRRHSRSPQPRKRTRSPRRISRSRSPSFSISRSRSRSKSSNRYKAPLHTRYRSPPRGSPRNRFRDGNRRNERRDDFNRDRDDFRDRSPGFYSHRGRSSYRGRGRSHFRHDRLSNMPLSIPANDYSNYPAQVPSTGYDDGQYHPPPRYIAPRGLSPGQQIQPRLSEYLPPPMHIVQPSVEPASHYDDPNRYDEAPPGTQPPPPGEQSPIEQFSRDREKWNPEPERHRRTPDKSALPSFDERRHTPDLRDRLNADGAVRHRSVSRIERSDKRRSSKTPTHRDGRKDVETSRDHRSRDDKHEKASRKESDRDRSTKDLKDRHRLVEDRDVKREKDDRGKEDRDAKREKDDRSKEDRDAKREKDDRKTDDRKIDDRKVDDRKVDDRDAKREKDDRKAKEKKKKKKEEKALEKKKKKERKEKEKREKELRKEQDRARKLLESNIDRKSENNEDQSNQIDQLQDVSKDQDDFNDNSENISKELYDDVPNTPEKQLSIHVQASEHLHSTKMDDFDIDEGDDGDALKSETLGIKASATTKKETIRNDEHSMDLYGDIVGDDLDMGYPNDDPTVRRADDGSPAHPGALNRSDSILDIHANLDFEMDEIEPEAKKSSTGFLPFPELSKWERDDEMYSYGDKKSGSDTSPYDDKGKVTNEVIKRAENAIFTRAINAIRPIEIKKISTDRQKLYANEKRDHSPADTVGIAEDIQKTMKITVPVFTNEERSVELKLEGKAERDTRTKTPVRSIKDRLGSKVHNSPRSRTRTPPRKLLVDNGHNDSKDRSRAERNKKDDRSRDAEKRTVSNSRTMNDARRVHDPKRGGVVKEKDDRGRDDKHRDEKSNRKESERDRSTKDVKERHRVVDKIDEREQENRLRDRQRERERQMETDREKDREKEKERARQMARAREMERIKEMSRKQMDKEKVDKRDGKRERSDSLESKRRREHGKDDKKPKLDAERVPSKQHPASDRKRSSIDESKFVPDYDESDKKAEATRRKPVEIKHKEPEKRKSRSNSESSSSSDSDDSSDSSSDSEDKKRKKRKHKKQKRSKRASSTESEASSKKKKSKHKKSKKKKKGKGK